ncbi:hypothetical protein C8R44DRAFT_608813, partial [Mycena epipterygia]
MFCWSCRAPPAEPPPLRSLPVSPPELAPFLTNNDPPDDFHLPFDYLSLARPNLDLLDARMKVLETSIERLTDERRVLTYQRNILAKDVHQHECALAPIRRLPSELIGIIIRLCPDIRHETGYSEREHAPWRLATVCARWRACALVDRKIWANIEIYAHTYPKSFKRVFSLPKLETQLARSGDATLDVVL